jgi:hypothetical protein
VPNAGSRATPILREGSEASYSYPDVAIIELNTSSGKCRRERSVAKSNSEIQIPKFEIVPHVPSITNHKSQITNPS